MSTSPQHSLPTTLSASSDRASGESPERFVREQPLYETPPVRVRTATSDDAPFVIALAARFGSTRAAWRGEEEVVAGTARQLAAAFTANRGADAILIAVSATDERLGFAYVVTHDDFFTGEPHAHLSEIATLADRTGAGSVLLDACEAWARERGFRYLSLNVNDANESARHFYARRAYVPEYRHLVKLL